MANPEHVEIVKQGAKAIRKWRKENPRIWMDLEDILLEDIDLHGADLRRASLHNATLFEVDLSGANLTRAILFGAHLPGVTLRNAKLMKSGLDDVHFYGCDLSGADLSASGIRFARFDRTTLIGTDFSDARFAGTVFADVDLSFVKGLDCVVHEDSSTIGVGTIFKSSGRIPEIFLRGCGVPEIMIEYMHSLAGEALQFYKCFISFTEDDNDFSERLYNDLQAKGVRCWRWRDDATWGRTLMREVDQAIRVYDKLIVICSEKSLQSEPVIREIERALQKEQRERSEVLFPIRVDDSVFAWEHELQADLARKVIGDFTKWKDPGKYRTSLDRLIKALQAESPAASDGG